MKRLSRCLSLAFTIVLLVPFALADQTTPPKGFRNFFWGASPTKDLKKIAGPTDGVTMFVPITSKRPDPLFDIPVAEEAYSFSHGKFYRGDAWFDTKENFEKITVAFTKQYGPLAFSSPKVSLWKWKWLNSPVEVQLHYQEKFARTTVTFVNNRY